MYLLIIIVDYCTRGTGRRRYARTRRGRFMYICTRLSAAGELPETSINPLGARFTPDRANCAVRHVADQPPSSRIHFPSSREY